MSKSVSDGVRDDQGLQVDNGGKSSGFNRVAMNVDIAPVESEDQDKLIYDDECASDCESSTSVKQPIVNRTQSQPNIGIDVFVPTIGIDVNDLQTAESPIDESNNLQPKSGIDGLIRLNESDQFYRDIKTKFISAMGSFGFAIQVEHIERNLFNRSPICQAKLQSFLIYGKAMKEKRGGHANIRRAWFCASKDQIKKIILHGFSHDDIQKDGGFGYGLYLSTDDSVIESVNSTIVDDDGMRRIVLCRVILGNVEAVQYGSKQFQPSSEEFQSGVDDLKCAKKLIIWSTNINTHVILECVISFKTLPGYNGGIEGLQSHCPRPWIPIKELVSGLSKILPPETMQKITECHSKYKEGKISRRDMLLGFKDLAGERELLMAVEDCKEQQLKQDKMMDSNADIPPSK